MSLRRKADFRIGPEANPYLLRWHLLPQNRWFNVYLHKMLRSDDDRALHDHPWWNCSVVLRTGYFEVSPFRAGVRGYVSADLPYDQRRVWRGPGSVILRSAKGAHRLELPRMLDPPATWSLFLTGPKVRDWGFHCPSGWRPWKEYVKVVPGGNEIGRGCD